MRMLMQVKMPHEPFNTAVRNGTAGRTMTRILEDLRPEAAYFSEIDGHRTGIFIVDVPEPSRVPSLSEPWFLQFNADVRFHIVMSAEDLGRSGLEALGKKWGS